MTENVYQEMRELLLVKELGPKLFQEFEDALMAKWGNPEHVWKYLEWLADNGRLGAAIKAATIEKPAAQTVAKQNVARCGKNATSRRRLKRARLVEGKAEAKSLTAAQVAARMNVSRDCVYDLCRVGRLAHHRVGKGRGTIRIKPADVADFERRSLIETSAGPIVEGTTAAKRRRHLGL